MNPLSVVSVLLMAYVVNGQFVSPYAKGWGSYPGVLPQYSSGDADLSNRVGDASSSSTQNPQEELESRVANWPRERQPYWFINKQHIQNQQKQGVPIIANQQPTSSFVSGGK